MVRIEYIIGKSIQNLRLILIYTIIAMLLNPQFVLAKGEKSGRDLLITMKDGNTIKGELLAVQNRNLIIGNLSLFSGTELPIDQVDNIIIIKESKFLKGLGQGFLIGAVPGALIGLLSGDDSGGFIRFTAGQKALIGGLFLGLAGATVGGLVGALAGIDEPIDLSDVSPTRKDLYLEKLVSYARYGDSIPEELTIHPPTTIEVSNDMHTVDAHFIPAVQSASYAGRMTGHKPLKGFHLSITSGYFNSSGLDDLRDIITSVGFTDSRFSSGWFGSGARMIEYPRTVKRTKLYTTNITLEYSVKSNIAVGLIYTDLGKYGVTGRRVIHDVGNPDFGVIDTYISGFYSGNAGFLTVSYFPIPDAFLQRKSLKLTTGIGYSRSKMDFYASEWEYSYEYSDNYLTDDRRKFSNNAFGLLLSAELMHFFSNKWSVGVHADYKWVTVKSDRFSLNSYYSYWDAPHFQGGELRYEVSVVEIPKRTWNLGGFGYGINLGFHF
jgi:hypothetical protein